MKSFMRKSLSFLLSAISLTSVCRSYFAEVNSEPVGTAGGFSENFEWSIDDEGVLTIRGEGNMPSYEDGLGMERPWEKYNFTTLIIGDGVKSIGANSFSECKSLSTVIMADSVETVDSSAFSNCTNLESVKTSENLHTIFNYAFCGCKKLKNIPVGDSVIVIMKHAFDETLWLENQGEGVVYAGNVTYCFKGSYPSVIRIRKGTTAIADKAFTSGKTKTFILPEGVSYIGEEAFYASAIKSINIPSSVNNIGYDAFAMTFSPKIYGYRGTYAEKHCDNFIPIDFLIGDLDKNNTINIEDATILQRCFADYIYFAFDIIKNNLLADVNYDGVADINDVTEIQKILAGFDSEKN